VEGENIRRHTAARIPDSGSFEFLHRVHAFDLESFAFLSAALLPVEDAAKVLALLAIGGGHAVFALHAANARADGVLLVQ